MSLDSLISELLAAQSQEEAHRAAAATAAATATMAAETAGQRVLQLGAQLLEFRRSSAPFVYRGRLYTFAGSRVSSVAVEIVAPDPLLQGDGGQP